MPNLDKTGPSGEGPTGFGRGGCAPPIERGLRGRRQGLGLGRRAITQEEEEKMLETRLAEVKELKKEK